MEAAYAAFKVKYFSVTLGAIRSELTSNTAFSDVLALEPWRVGTGWDGRSDRFSIEGLEVCQWHLFSFFSLTFWKTSEELDELVESGC